MKVLSFLVRPRSFYGQNFEDNKGMLLRIPIKWTFWKVNCQECFPNFILNTLHVFLPFPSILFLFICMFSIKEYQFLNVHHLTGDLIKKSARFIDKHVLILVNIITVIGKRLRWAEHTEGLSVDSSVRIDVKEIGGFIRLRIWISGEPLWMLHWNSRFHKP